MVRFTEGGLALSRSQMMKLLTFDTSFRHYDILAKTHSR